jgi:hypothetical protein
MKTIIRYAFIAILAFNANMASADNSSSKELSKNTKEYRMSKEEAKRLVSRIKEIRSMDKSNLSAQQKKDLRNEVLAIKEQLNKGGKAYVLVLSTTAIIIIILLIILL